MSQFVLHESASGYAIFSVDGIDEIGQNTEAVRSSVVDFNRFAKVVVLAAFRPFESAHDALNQINAISEGKNHATMIEQKLFGDILSMNCFNFQSKY